MNILFLAHRIPYPPNKGDKIRSFHQLKHLASFGSVYLGTLIDDARDVKYETNLKKICDEVKVVTITSKIRKLVSVLGHIKGKPASVCHFYDRRLQQWVDEILVSKKIDFVFCFSSTMAEYLFCSSQWDKLQQGNVKLLMDYCDVDSQKWLDYSRIKKWPLAGFFAHEGMLLIEYEQRIADTFNSCFLASSREKSMFDERHRATNVEILENGVDLDFFSNHTPFDSREQDLPILVFTGAMDYDVNIDGVCWFVDKIWPRIVQRGPEVQFYIVGSKPTPDIISLGKKTNIVVTGYVDDIREFYTKATICIAPLQIARGIQNKILEALAMSKAVVCTDNAFEGINAEAGEDLLVLNKPEDFADGVVALLADAKRRQKMGVNGRSRMEKNYSWDAKLRVLEENLGVKTLASEQSNLG